ncbi:hypothetical protein BC828DRAFT_382115 [Blastocladiella britannica]|nr:hypothetical protein BC828DRAFT_382115 [Blastocladiella britannica]
MSMHCRRHWRSAAIAIGNGGRPRISVVVIHCPSGSRNASTSAWSRMTGSSFTWDVSKGTRPAAAAAATPATASNNVHDDSVEGVDGVGSCSCRDASTEKTATCAPVSAPNALKAASTHACAARASCHARYSWSSGASGSSIGCVAADVLLPIKCAIAGETGRAVDIWLLLLLLP